MILPDTNAPRRVKTTHNVIAMHSQHVYIGVTRLLYSAETTKPASEATEAGFMWQTPEATGRAELQQWIGTMLTDTTLRGKVGEPTPVTITNDLSLGKGDQATPSYFDSRCDRGDDFDDMEAQGLQSTTVSRLRRIALGLTGIREITRVLSVFETERVLQELDAKGSTLSPRSHEGILRGAEVLADLLTQEIYALGTDLTRHSAGAPR